MYQKDRLESRTIRPLFWGPQDVVVNMSNSEKRMIKNAIQLQEQDSRIRIYNYEQEALSLLLFPDSYFLFSNLYSLSLYLTLPYLVLFSFLFL